MSRCEEIRPLLYPYLDQELGPERADLVKEHLDRCPECERRADAERRFLARVAEAGRETAPEPLRARVEAILAGVPEEVEAARETPVTPIRGAGWRRWLVPAAAAAALALLLVRPWGGPPAAAFASDHEAHAVLAPSSHPFPEGAPVPAPPPLAGARLAGLSECVVDGRTYAHYTYVIGGEHVSIFLPAEGVPIPDAGATRAGSTTILSVDATAGIPAAVLVSGDLEAEELQAIWPGA